MCLISGHQQPYLRADRRAQPPGRGRPAPGRAAPRGAGADRAAGRVRVRRDLVRSAARGGGVRHGQPVAEARAARLLPRVLEGAHRGDPLQRAARDRPRGLAMRACSRPCWWSATTTGASRATSGRSLPRAPTPTWPPSSPRGPTTSPAGCSRPARPVTRRLACTPTRISLGRPRPTRCSVAGYREDDICLSVPKLFFGYATGTNLMFPFRVGATAVLFPGRSTADELFDQIERHRPTFLTSVPTLINNMLRSPRIERTPTSLLCASASRLEKRSPPSCTRNGSSAPRSRSSTASDRPRCSTSTSPTIPGDVRLGSLGRIVPGYEATVVDAEGREVPDGEPGRLRVRGGSTAICYWADKSKSRETFQGEWCTSGDVFRRDARGLLLLRGPRRRPAEGFGHLGLAAGDRERAAPAPGGERGVRVRQGGRGRDWSSPWRSSSCARARSPVTRRPRSSRRTPSEHMAPYKYPRWFVWRESLPKNDRGKVARKELKAEIDAS